MLLADEHGDAALVFTCTGRGTNLFAEPDHDARVVHAQVDGGATAGMGQHFFFDCGGGDPPPLAVLGDLDGHRPGQLA